MKYLDYLVTPLFYVVAFKIFGIVDFKFPEILMFYVVAVVIHIGLKKLFIGLVKLSKNLRNK